MIDPRLPIVGTDVVIRKLEAYDVKSLYSLESNPEVKRYVGGCIAKPENQWINEMTLLCLKPRAVLPFTIACKSTNDFIGRTALSLQDREAQSWEIQVVIGQNNWGKRLGQQVVEMLMKVLIETAIGKFVIAIVHPDNRASITMVERLKFVNIGTRMSSGWDNGHLIFQKELTNP